MKGNYVDSQKKVLWDSEKNKAYHHRITAIGRDNSFELVQKQSQSAHDSLGFLLLSAGKIAPTNAANTTPIAHGDFILIGDNNLSLTSTKADKY